jgi:hypothetical protein
MNENDTKIVRITNIASFDFIPEMGAMYDGRHFPLRAGESKLFPLTVGDHLATHLARQILIKKAPIRDASETDGRGKDLPLWNETTIEELKKKIMAEVYEEEKPPVHSPADAVVKKVEDLNKVTVDVTDNPPVSTTGYKDKAEVIAELQKRGVKFDARKSKADLETLLK